MLKKALYLVAVILLIALGMLAYEFYSFSQQRNQHVQQQGQAVTDALRGQIDEILSRITGEGERLAKLFGENEFSESEIKEIIKKSALDLPEIQGVTAAFEPFGLSKDQRLFCPYYNKGTQDFMMIEDSYDYTLAGSTATAWYTQVRDGGKKWVEPYFAKAAQDWYVDFGIPFHYGQGPNKGKVRGTITLSLLCQDFGDLIHTLSLGKTGYGLITSNAGTFLAHPTRDLVGKGSLIDWQEKHSPNSAMAQACQSVLAGESGSVTFMDAQSNDQTLFFYDQIPDSHWTLGLMFSASDLATDLSSMSRRYINLAIVLSLFLVCLLAMYYNKDELDAGEIWRLSFVSSILLLSNIFVVGYLEHSREPSKDENASHPVIDVSALNAYVKQQQQNAADQRLPALTPIPTGIFIQRMDFQDSYNLNLSGTVWQKYPLDLVDQIEPGFDLPQMSPFAEASLIEESYRERVAAKEGEAGHQLIGWKFRVTLLLNFQYDAFPFDKRQINIEIVPKRTSDRLILVPDLASYKFTNPSRNGGLSPMIVMSGVEIVESYFNFSVQSFDTDFGWGAKGNYESVPVLHYNVHLRRNLLNAFVTYLIPIVVALVMIFILIFACRKTTERQGIIESMAAFIFVLIFSHIDLRKEVVTGNLIYLEYFYFTTYVIVLLSTFNLIAYTLDKTTVFDLNENQLFKAYFFPFFLTCILLVTLVKFY